MTVYDWQRENLPPCVITDANGDEIGPDVFWLDDETGRGERAKRNESGQMYLDETTNEPARESFQVPTPITIKWK